MTTQYGSHGSYNYSIDRPASLTAGSLNRREYLDPSPSGTKALPGKAVKLPLTQRVMSLGGLAVLTCLISLPVSDSAILLHDFNYLFWVGKGLPAATIIALVALTLAYYIWSSSTGAKGIESMTIHDLVTAVSTFVCMLGVIMVLTSLYLYWNGYHVTSALMYDCAGSMATRDLRQSYTSLLNLRKTPACAQQFSVADCAGYSEAAPAVYADYLQSLESDYHCSGFCYSAAAAPSLLEVAGHHNKSLPDVSSFLSRSSSLEGMNGMAKAYALHRESYLPPALFSQSTYKTSCDGAAARNLTFLALGISHVWWWIGVALIGISAVVGLGEWFCCIHKIK